MTRDARPRRSLPPLRASADRRRATPALALAAALALAGCPDDDHGIAPRPDATPGADDAATDDGPFADVELAREIEDDGLAGEAYLVRDEQGIPHVYAESEADAFFTQGYVTAHDRLFQMDILRRTAAGTLSELYGAQTVDQDLEMRLHRMVPLAEETLAELRASESARDAAIVTMLERYSAGVNAYAEALAAGDESLDPAVGQIWAPDAFEPWTPADSLALGRLMAFQLSYDAPDQIAITELFGAAFDVYGDPDASDDALAAREGAHADLVRMRPVREVSTVDGFPAAGASAAAARPRGGAKAPRPSRALLRGAQSAFSHEVPAGLDARPDGRDQQGSNSWVLAPELAGGRVTLAGDQHLQLANPSTFYPTHLMVPGELGVQGVVFPGVPGVVLGHNGDLAWSGTTARHDVLDVYAETIVPCAEESGDCAVFEGDEVPLETREETIRVGAFGAISDEIDVVYEEVPHHGPIVPSIDDGSVDPRGGGGDDEALSIRYTGYEISHELRAFYDLMSADSVDAGIEALEAFQFGAQDFLLADASGSIGWTAHADVPARAPAAHTFHPTENPEGLAPWMILPGEGQAEWEGYRPAEELPRVIDPEQGYLVTANADPVGATFDGDPLGGPVVDGRPLYLAARYAHGLRVGRITDLIEARVGAGQPVLLGDTAAIQHDTRSTFGAVLRPRMNEAFGLLDEGDPPADVADFLDDQAEDTLALMGDAAAAIAEWSLETPPAVRGQPTAAEVTDSAATTIFNAWMHFFLDRALSDAYRALGEDDAHSARQDMVERAAVALLAAPETLESGLAPETGQPILCDDMETVDVVESCDRIALEALALAVEWASGPDVYGTDDVSAWRWGERHTLTLESLVPAANLRVGPLPRAGESNVVSVSPSSFADLSMRHEPHGPAQRFIATGEPGAELRAKIQIPGGAVFHRDSPHYRDFLDDYFVPKVHAEFPRTHREISEAGRERWRLGP